MIGREEINVKFYVDRSEDIDTKVSRWYLLLKNTNKEGSGSLVCQRWNHKPTQKEIDNATFAAKQGISFITIHLATERPPRYVQVLMPRIRINIKE